MTRRTFFSFHYQRDIFRVNQVRNSGQFRREDEANFFDASLWEEAQLKGDEAIKRLIDAGLQRSSVTVVLIGKETFDRPFVRYEIIQSYNRNNGLIGIRIHGLKNQNQQVDTPGRNPFENVRLQDGRLLSEFVPVYDYVLQDGYHNMVSWIEKAAQKVGR
jgi:hypothetical protein